MDGSKSHRLRSSGILMHEVNATMENVDFSTIFTPWEVATLLVLCLVGCGTNGYSALYLR